MSPEPSVIAPAYSFNLDRFLEALSQVESGDYDLAEGLHGERGRYQIKQSTWEKHCLIPFSTAVHYSNSRVVAIRIICDYLVKAKSQGCSDKMLPNVVAFWWCCGEHASHANKWKRDEIQRILNLYEL